MSEAYHPPPSPGYGAPASPPPGRALAGWALGLALAAIVISLLALAAALFSSGYFYGFGMVEDGFEEGSPPVEGTVEDLGGLGEGDCFDAVLLQPETIEQRQCAQVHDAEVYLVTSTGALFEDDYPGDEEVYWAGDDECYEAFEGYAGEYVTRKQRPRLLTQACCS